MGESNDLQPTAKRGRGFGGAVLDEVTLDDLVQRVVQLAAITVAEAHSVSISIRDDGGYWTSHSTRPEARAVDEAQYLGDDGPCVEAARTARQMQMRVGQDGRWHAVSAKALEFGLTGVLSSPLLRAEDDAVGALNIYTAADAPFGADQARTAELLANHAAILVTNAAALVGATELNEQLRQAVASRELIGEAKGILMERQSCTRDQAFDILRRASQRENRRLRELAEDLVLSTEARAHGTSSTS